MNNEMETQITRAFNRLIGIFTTSLMDLVFLNTQRERERERERERDIYIYIW